MMTKTISILLAAATMTIAAPQAYAQGPYVPEGQREITLPANKVYVPRAGTELRSNCNYSNECVFWEVPANTVYERAVYAAWVVWTAALVLLGIGACALISTGIVALMRDILKRDDRRGTTPAPAVSVGKTGTVAAD